MNTLLAFIKRIAVALVLFGAFAADGLWGGASFTARDYTVAALLAGFIALNALPPKGSARQGLLGALATFSLPCQPYRFISATRSHGGAMFSNRLPAH